MRLIDIARELGVSYTTVSLTLNGKAERYGISKATQARILAYAEEVGYVKDLNASRVAIGAADQVGILINSEPRGLNESQRTLFFQLMKLLYEKGMMPIIQAVDTHTFMAGVRNLLGRKVENVIAIGGAAIKLCQETPQFTALLKERRLLLVDYLFNVQDAQMSLTDRTYYIGYDRQGSFRAMLRAIQAEGHRVIAVHHDIFRFLGGLDADEAQSRLLPLLGIQPYETNMYRNGHRLLAQVQACRREAGCTAVMLQDDMKAIGLIAALQDAGVRVPEEMSVVGYEGIPSAEYARVPLTTIEIPTAGMVQLIGDILLRGREAPTADGAQRIYRLPCTLIRRDSLGAAPR